MQDIIETPVNPFTGNAIATDQKDGHLLILTSKSYNRNETEIEINIHNSYYIHDNIFDEKNWSKPEKIP
jgi:hypothetical protein